MRWLKVLAIAVAVVIVFFVISSLTHILYLIGVGLLIAAALFAAVKGWEQYKLARERHEATLLAWLRRQGNVPAVARELLELTDEPVENLGRLTGLGSSASVRAIFHRRLGTSPYEYRTMFRADGTTS